MSVCREVRNGIVKYRAEIRAYGDKKIKGKRRSTIDEARIDEENLKKERDRLIVAYEGANKSKSKYVRIFHVNEIKVLLEEYVNSFSNDKLTEEARVYITKSLLTEISKIYEILSKETKC